MSWSLILVDHRLVRTRLVLRFRVWWEVDGGCPFNGRMGAGGGRRKIRVQQIRRYICIFTIITLDKILYAHSMV